MKKYFLLMTILTVSLLSNAQSKIWTNDPAHSRLGFTIKHLTISEVEGRFANFSVKVITTKADYMDAKVVLIAKVPSINTNSDSRDTHLRSADFFDAQKYPVMTFKSTSVKKINAKKGLLSGNLTMHGITKPVTLTVEYFGSVVNPMNKKETVGFKVTGVVKRSDFALGPKFAEALLGNEVNIVANVEFSPNK
ncbi:MAG: YceI family protein [Bacteroidaceae bacterium]|nr:YceI family protein [Bacteroidaceae bacterium]